MHKAQNNKKIADKVAQNVTHKQTNLREWVSE